VLFALVYLLLRRVVRLIAGSSNDELSTEVELLVLRHQLKVLKRQVGRPRLRRSDRRSWPRSAGSFLVLGGPRSWSAHRRSFGGTGSS
jgi:hypothetical protein